MQLDPQMKAVLDKYASFNLPDPNDVPPQMARRAPSLAEAVKSLLKDQGKDPAPIAVGRVQDRTFDGPGGSVSIRIYTPMGTGPFPITLYIHGGGWVIADLDVYDSSARALCQMASCVVVSTHYRQAPENRYPAAVEDVYAAYRWTLNNASALNGDPSRIAVAGESAGGNMAAVTCLIARSHGDPMPVHQVLVYPVSQYGDFDTPSYDENRQTKPLNRELMLWFWDKYLPEDDAARERAKNDPYASPLRAPDLSGLPPATIVLAEYDPLRSEGESYADRLRQAGVQVDINVFPGVTHEFFGMGAVVDLAKDAEQMAADGLRASFGMPPYEQAQIEDVHNDRRVVRPDMQVVGANGDEIGRVKHVRQSDFLIDRSLARDVYAPLDAVERVDGNQLRLMVSSDEVTDRGWPESLAA